MSETLTLPVLPLDDEVVLPGMVVPVELSDPEVRAQSRRPGTAGGSPGDPGSVRKNAESCCPADRRPGLAGRRHAR